MIFGKNLARVELYLNRSRAVENKWIYDQLEKERQEIEGRFEAELLWQRLDDKKPSRISLQQPFDGYDEKNWPGIVVWLCEHIVKLEAAVSEPLERLNRELKSQSGLADMKKEELS